MLVFIYQRANKQRGRCTTNSPLRIVHYYELRWRIEDFHKTWKSDGTQVEKLRLQTKANMERLSTILAFVAVRLMQLKDLALNKEEAKQKSCEVMFSPVEWQILWKKQEKSKRPTKAPSLYWAYYALARLGGWYDSKRTGRVGVKAIWEGWQKLMLMLEGYQVMRQLESQVSEFILAEIIMDNLCLALLPSAR